MALCQCGGSSASPAVPQTPYAPPPQAQHVGPPPGMFGLSPIEQPPQPIAPKQKVMDARLQQELAARGPMFYPALPGYAPKRGTNFIGGAL